MRTGSREGNGVNDNNENREHDIYDDDNFLMSLWKYTDRKGRMQGPFKGTSIRKWVQDKYPLQRIHRPEEPAIFFTHREWLTACVARHGEPPPLPAGLFFARLFFLPRLRGSARPAGKRKAVPWE